MLPQMKQQLHCPAHPAVLLSAQVLTAHITAQTTAHLTAHSAHCPPPHLPLHCSPPQCLANRLLTTCDATLARATLVWAEQGRAWGALGVPQAPCTPRSLQPGSISADEAGDRDRSHQPSVATPPKAQLSPGRLRLLQPPGTLNKQRVVTSPG